VLAEEEFASTQKREGDDVQQMQEHLQWLHWKLQRDLLHFLPLPLMLAVLYLIIHV
jgi:hypothetical protein